jgi:hypothetical protein
MTRIEFIRRYVADQFWHGMARKPEDRTPLSRDEANSLLISCLVNRGIQWERAMSLVDEMKTRTGYTDTIKMFTELNDTMIEWHMFADYAAVDNEGKPLPSLHRYRYMAEYCCLAAAKIVRDYDGDIRNIWKDEPTGQEFLRRIFEFKGLKRKCGGLFARCAVLSHGVILWDNYAGLDISPDVHVCRVMKRLGLVDEDATTQEVVIAARELSPYAPVEWEGLWLHAIEVCGSVANCGECFISRACPSRR